MTKAEIKKAVKAAVKAATGEGQDDPIDVQREIMGILESFLFSSFSDDIEAELDRLPGGDDMSWGTEIEAKIEDQSGALPSDAMENFWKYYEGR